MELGGVPEGEITRDMDPGDDMLPKRGSDVTVGDIAMAYRLAEDELDCKYEN